MSNPVTISEADQALCLAVMKQAEVAKVDYHLLQAELGLPTSSAARMRWTRFEAKLNGKTTSSSEAGKTKATAFTAADQELCVAVFKQTEIAKVDYKVLQAELGLPTSSAARMRWTRFIAKLNGKSPEKIPGTPKSKVSTKDKKTPGSTKRKMNGGEAEDIGTTETGEGDKENGGGEGAELEMSAAETPSRKRAKRTKVKAVKNEKSDGEGDDGKIEKEQSEAEDMQTEDSGYGGTPDIGYYEEFEEENFN